MICALIVSYNSQKVFRCYESVKNQVDFVVIVDNGTKDKGIIEGLEKVQHENNNCSLIFNGDNLGIAVALNQGAKYAKDTKAEWLLTLDDDSQLYENTVSALMKDYESLPEPLKEKTAIVALKYEERGIKTAIKNDDKTAGFEIVKYALTSGNFIKTKIFDCGLFFNEELFIDQVDNDFDFQVRKNGFVILESYSHFILHELGLSQKKCGFVIRNYSPIRRYYLSRNCTYILKRYLLFDFWGVLRIFIGSILGGLFKITFFENQKLEKYKCVFCGIKDALSNKFGEKFNS
ncbi:MAG: glycosyltransferase [Elusimicrobiota bacterium]|jgi:rhamnosyltransferase|nr:glycosyltransferase [Elusimicrobiota bacterium]